MYWKLQTKELSLQKSNTVMWASLQPGDGWRKQRNRVREKKVGRCGGQRADT